MQRNYDGSVPAQWIGGTATGQVCIHQRCCLNLVDLTAAEEVTPSAAPPVASPPHPAAAAPPVASPLHTAAAAASHRTLHTLK